MRPRIVAGLVVCVLGALAWIAPQVRRALIYDVVHWDAVPASPATFPGGAGVGLSPTPRTRVVLIDGLSAEVAATLDAFGKLCARGVTATVDVGFPTVSLPVEVAL